MELVLDHHPALEAVALAHHLDLEAEDLLPDPANRRFRVVLP